MAIGDQHPDDSNWVVSKLLHPQVMVDPWEYENKQHHVRIHCHASRWQAAYYTVFNTKDKWYVSDSKGRKKRFRKFANAVKCANDEAETDYAN